VIPLVSVVLFQAACYRTSHPEKPKTVPREAVWAGGLDSGGWVLCSIPSPAYNVCTIYDEEGSTPGPSRYALSGRAANAQELKYTYVTGKAIGLEGSFELKRIDEEQ